jgi:hypothetical protein
MYDVPLFFIFYLYHNYGRPTNHLWLVATLASCILACFLGNDRMGTVSCEHYPVPGTSSILVQQWCTRSTPGRTGNPAVNHHQSAPIVKNVVCTTGTCALHHTTIPRPGIHEAFIQHSVIQVQQCKLFLGYLCREHN